MSEPISRKEALAISREIIEQAERERVPTPTDHTLNACLARVIGKEITFDEVVCEWFESKVTAQSGASHSIVHGKDSVMHYGPVWNPIANPVQMELVEAWLRENKWEYISGWNSQFNRHWVELRKGVKAFWTNDPDKKRAFALAVWQMEQHGK